jgi:hypothetical protein
VFDTGNIMYELHVFECQEVGEGPQSSAHKLYIYDCNEGGS